MLCKTGGAIGMAALSFRKSRAQQTTPPSGAIAGEATAARIGQQVLDGGGSAIDAILSAALIAAIVSPHNCGIGGYGGHMIIAHANQQKIRAIDFNTTAPRRAQPDMFAPDASGRVPDGINEHGWLAAGVPGVIAGIELAARRHATRPFSELLAPAIELAETGFPFGKKLAAVIRANANGLRNDPATAAIYLRNGEPPREEDLFRNPDLARLLRVLAKENSVEPFYRGAIAQTIADGFARGGGLVTLEDLRAYEAREVDPVTLSVGPFAIHTAPLTAGGSTALEAVNILQQLDWRKLASEVQTHARVEAMRIAWAERLGLFGDPDFVSVPVAKLLSKEHAAQQAATIRSALEAKTKVARSALVRPDHGTVNLSCCDRAGNVAALTLTHGNSFGAQVTIPGLGLTLGHGMSRFDPQPDRPNSIAPAKRPLHNMCPTIVTRDGRPFLAVGGAGGRKIPNAVLDLLLGVTMQGLSAREALDAPRCHTIGDDDVTLEARWNDRDADYLKSIGYRIHREPSAFVSIAFTDPGSGDCIALAR
jgi:gamma-glutamyltranspeptidase/glutathione hydrolase